MDQKGVMLTEMSQTKTNIAWFYLYVQSKKQNKWTNITKQKESYRYIDQTSEGEGERKK